MTQPARAPAKLAAMMAPLQARFRAGLDDRILRMEAAATLLREDPNQPDALAAIRQECHKIAGVAPTLGYADIGAQALEIDIVLSEHAGGWDDVSGPLDTLLDALDLLIDAAA